MTQSQEALHPLPCPFCGAPADQCGFGGSWYIRCSSPHEENCWARQHGSIWVEIEDAIAAWNRRVVRPVSGSESTPIAPKNIAAWADFALTDSLIDSPDGEKVYDDALFAKALAGNGYRIVPASSPIVQGEGEREKVAGQLRCLAGIAQDAPDGFTQLNDAARDLLRKAAALLSLPPERSGALLLERE